MKTKPPAAGALDDDEDEEAGVLLTVLPAKENAAGGAGAFLGASASSDRSAMGTGLGGFLKMSGIPSPAASDEASGVRSAMGTGLGGFLKMSGISKPDAAAWSGSVKSAIGTGFGGFLKISGISNAGGCAASLGLSCDEPFLRPSASSNSPCTFARCSTYLARSFSSTPSPARSTKGSLSTRSDRASRSETLRARRAVKYWSAGDCPAGLGAGGVAVAPKENEGVEGAGAEEEEEEEAGAGGAGAEKELVLPNEKDGVEDEPLMVDDTPPPKAAKGFAAGAGALGLEPLEPPSAAKGLGAAMPPKSDGFWVRSASACLGRGCAGANEVTDGCTGSRRSCSASWSLALGEATDPAGHRE